MEALKVEKPKRGTKKSIEPKWLKKYPQITRTQAIQLFCRECMGYTKNRGGGPESQAWVKAGFMAKDCTDNECPLYIFRPGAKKGLRLVSKYPVRPQKNLTEKNSNETFSFGFSALKGN